MSNDIVEVPFNGSAMIAQRFDDGEIYTALKPICENIGIAYNGQWERLNRTPWATIRMIRTVGADGKQRDMVAISRKTLTMWLATIDTNRLHQPCEPTQRRTGSPQRDRLPAGSRRSP